MNRPKNIGLGLLLLFFSSWTYSAAYSELAAEPSNPAPRPAATSEGKEGSTDLQPGLVARGYLGGDHPALQSPTRIVFIIKTGTEFPEGIRPQIENELRGTMDVGRLEYTATGLINLTTDTEVRFDIKNMVCKVDGKDFGDGKYTRPMQQGTHRIELIRRGWASGKPSFAITDSTNQPVLFHTAEALQREIARSIKIEDKATKSKLLGSTISSDAPSTVVATAALNGDAAHEFNQLTLDRDKAIATAVEPINNLYKTALEALVRRATLANDLDTAVRIKQTLDRLSTKTEIVGTWSFVNHTDGVKAVVEFKADNTFVWDGQQVGMWTSNGKQVIITHDNRGGHQDYYNLPVKDGKLDGTNTPGQRITITRKAE